MSNPSDTLLRNVLGPNLQTAALRAVLFLAGFAVIGALLAWLIR